MLERVSGAFVRCDPEGCVLCASPSGTEVLARIGVDLTSRPIAILPAIWREIVAQSAGEASCVRGGADHDVTLACTRYAVDDDWLLVFSELSHGQSELTYRLHQQHLESLGRVVATAVHDLRAPLSSIVFGIHVLAREASELSRDRTREILRDLQAASQCLRETIDCVLDFLRFGPPSPSAVSIKNVLARTQSLLRPQLRLGPHSLIVEAHDDVFVRGNLLTIEQIFVNLVVNSLEASAGPTTVRVSTSIQEQTLRVLVEDDGPGIAAAHLQRVFEPMFTTKQHGVGLGLASARECARSVDGDVQLTRWQGGTAFEVLLPVCAPEEGR